MSDMTPFRIDVPQAELEDLADRLARTRWPSEIPGVGWDRGVPVDYLRDLAEFWRTSYDWRKHEAELNSYPQFTTTIDGQRVHFLHVTSPHENALPLILSHGWPGSVVEFLKMIGPLTEPEDPADAFHVVVPSTPGCGFSGWLTEPGWDSFRIAKAYAELMDRLGYQRFGAQGGDHGAFIAPDLGRVAPDRVVGVHVNAATVGFIPFGEVDEATLAGFTDIERARLDRMNNYMAEGNGYFQVQATRPQTIGYALNDSPVGQLAWIVEKFKEWTHPTEDLPEKSIDRDHILTNVMTYWLTGTGASSAHQYYENMHSGNWPTPSPVPTGVAVFAEDISIRQFGEQSNNIVHWSDFEHGGHFAALEVPELLTADVREFFRPLR